MPVLPPMRICSSSHYDSVEQRIAAGGNLNLDPDINDAGVDVLGLRMVYSRRARGFLDYHAMTRWR